MDPPDPKNSSQVPLSWQRACQTELTLLSTRSPIVIHLPDAKSTHLDERPALVTSVPPTGARIPLLLSLRLLLRVIELLLRVNHFPIIEDADGCSPFAIHE